MAWSDAVGTTAESAIALLNMWAIVWAAPRVLGPETLRKYLLGALAAITVLSAAAALLPYGRTGGRVSGITGNPNSLALVLLLLVPLAMTRRSTRSLVPVALLILIGTASRGALLGIVAESLLVIRAIGRRAMRWLMFLAVGVTLTVGAFAVLREDVTTMEAQAENPSLVRTDNSREEQWRSAVSAVRAAPLLGAGWDAYPLDPASSYLKILTELGIIGSVLLVSVFRHVRAAARQGGTAIAAVALGGLINAVFESWLLVGGSFFSLVFWLVLSSVQLSDEDL